MASSLAAESAQGSSSRRSRSSTQKLQFTGYYLRTLIEGIHRISPQEIYEWADDDVVTLVLADLKEKELDDPVKYRELKIRSKTQQSRHSHILRATTVMLRLKADPDKVPDTDLPMVAWAEYVENILSARTVPGDDGSTSKLNTKFKYEAAYGLIITVFEDLEQNRDGYFQRKLEGPVIADIVADIKTVEDRELAVLAAEKKRKLGDVKGFGHSRSPAGYTPAVRSANEANLKTGIVMDNVIIAALANSRRTANPSSINNSVNSGIGPGNSLSDRLLLSVKGKGMPSHSNTAAPSPALDDSNDLQGTNTQAPAAMSSPDITGAKGKESALKVNLNKTGNKEGASDGALLMSGGLSNIVTDAPAAQMHQHRSSADGEEMDFVADSVSSGSKPYRGSQAGRQKQVQRIKRSREDDSGDDSGDNLRGMNAARPIAKPRKKRIASGEGVKGGERGEAGLFDVSHSSEDPTSRSILSNPVGEDATTSTVVGVPPDYDAETAPPLASSTPAEGDDDVVITGVINKSKGPSANSHTTSPVNNEVVATSKKLFYEKSVDEMTPDDVRYLKRCYDRQLEQNKDKTVRLKTAAKKVGKLENKVEELKGEVKKGKKAITDAKKSKEAAKEAKTDAKGAKMKLKTVEKILKEREKECDTLEAALGVSVYDL